MLPFPLRRGPRQVAVPARAKASRTTGLRATTHRTGPNPHKRFVHWTLGYLGKHAAQKILGAVPYGYRAQVFVKRASGRTDRFVAADATRERARRKISRFNAAGIKPPGIVVEQGTGWLGLDLVLFHLGGARRIFTYDTTPWLRPDLLRRNAEVLAASPDIVKRWRGSVPEDVDERAVRLRRCLDGPPETLLERLGVNVRVTRSMDRSGIGSASVDLFYSDSVLQFMEPRDLTALVRQARRFLKASGRCFHRVDCLDSNARSDARIPPLAFLAWPEPAWKLLTSRYLNYQNRWRLPRFVALFETEGFAVRAVRRVVDAEDLAYARRRLARLARFRDMSPEDIATRSFLLTGGTS